VSRERTSQARKRRTWRAVAGVAAGAVLVGGGFAAANAATTSGQKTAAHFAVDKKATGTAAVVSAANAFLNTLDSDQQTATVLDFSQANATAWSNLPCAGTCRPGIDFGSLSDAQLTAAESVLKVALGSGKDTGYEHVMQTILADDVLASAESTGSAAPAPGATATSTATSTATATDTASSTAAPTDAPTDAPTGAPPSGGTGGGGGGGFAYGSGYYYLAFLGTPSRTGTWQLHFGGHHLAVNITFKNGKVAGASPFFSGIEPTSWTADDGTTYEPMAAFRDGMLALTGSLTTEQLAAAKLSESFGDVLLGPGSDGEFPATKEGLKVSELSPRQQKLVLAAIHPWVADVDDATAKQLMKTYAKELKDTYISYSGGTGLDTNGDYVRIDGPGVWVEFICQTGVVYRDKVHYHTVYRDHTRDYGSEFSFS
jgi:hypothetical protein